VSIEDTAAGGRAPPKDGHRRVDRRHGDGDDARQDLEAVEDAAKQMAAMGVAFKDAKGNMLSRSATSSRSS
jgi:hypothetical protein